MRPPTGLSVASLRRIVTLTYREWRSDRTIRLGAGLAYYGLFSLTSVLAIAAGLMRIVGRSDAVEAAITERIVELAGESSAASVSAAFDNLTGTAGTSVGLIGLASLLVTGSLFFVALEDAMNQIWHVPVRSGLRSSVQRRLVSLVVLFGAAVTLTVSFFVQTASSLLERFLPGSAPGLEALSSIFTSVLSWSVLAIALTLLFTYLPRREVPWYPAVTAAVTTAVFLVIGTALIGWYLRTVGASSVGGVASTPIVILLWIYYEAQIVLAGVQLSKVLTR